MPDKIKILLVDDDQLALQLIGDLLKEHKVDVEKAGDGIEALHLMSRKSFDIVVTDLEMPKMDGMKLLAAIRTKTPHTTTIMLSGSGNVGTAVEAIKLGAYDYIEKPVKPEIFHALINDITEKKKKWEGVAQAENNQRKTYRFENIIGCTPQMHLVFNEIRDVANTDVPVLIIGENGTGKELVADAIHFRHSKGKSYVKINCGALAESVVESELFGHEKGSFTGASSLQKGRIELADGGTLFLDEFGELTPAIQVKLLRVLETGEFQRVGGTKTLISKFRLICATNKNLAKAVLEKEFREDLYYRINTVTINLPPLRERRDDIPSLVDYFLKRSCRQTKKKITHISKKVLTLLMNYGWPGNIRELAHVIERGVIYCKKQEMTTDHLPRTVVASNKSDSYTLKSPSKTLADVESTLINNILKESQWNLKLAAQTLGIARGTLYSKIEKYGIVKP